MKPGTINKEIIVSERIGVHRSAEFVRVGIPFARGELHNPEELALLSPEQSEQPFQAASLNRWSDRSIKWLLLDFSATVPPLGQVTYSLVTCSGEHRQAVPRVHVSPGNDTWQVDTGAAVFSIDARIFRPFSSVQRADGAVLVTDSNCLFFTSNCNRPVAHIESITIETEGPLRIILAVQGRFTGTGKDTPRFSSKLSFFAGSSCVQLDFTIHNPRRAWHRGGLWDLGDPGSFLFKELSMEFCFPEGKISEIICFPEDGIDPIRSDGAEGCLSLYQESSCGENWLSPVHRTRDGGVPFTFNGYEIRSGERQAAMGGRATPLFWCGSGSSGVAAVLPRFWQEFPKAFTADKRQLKISLFPADFPALHELQGGEQKTHRVFINFAATPSALEWARSPLTVIASPEVIQQAGVIAELPPVCGERDVRMSLVEQFISGPEDLLRKREVIDEYGWRNFGELYADHEAVYHQGTEPFVSHYNNQYDPCAGMYRMFLATGNPLWGELASDLAHHVLDIDIYHTNDDREEYNHGLFWHTDHYVAVGLATHRSFSREQIGKRDPRYCGGGPGAEHCYTTGLLLHYVLSGETHSRDAVVSLAEWCYRSLCGSQTILAAVKRAGRYLSMLRSVDKCNPPLFPRFPLSRGTGNAVNACIDAFEVSGDLKFLTWADELIRGTLHPDDDIDSRDLLDAENAWSYTVLLVAVANYLGKKVELEQRDNDFAYARACFLAYANWMIRHEYPYLDKPEILEYPNETWPAQDLRKSVIFYHAARYADHCFAKECLAKALTFYQGAQDQLSHHGSSCFTRPVALMLQNGWVASRLEDKLLPVFPDDTSHVTFGNPTPSLSLSAVVQRIGSDLTRSLRATSLHNELSWLRARMQKHSEM